MKHWTACNDLQCLANPASFAAECWGETPCQQIGTAQPTHCLCISSLSWILCRLKADNTATFKLSFICMVVQPQIQAQESSSEFCFDFVASISNFQSKLSFPATDCLRSAPNLDVIVHIVTVSAFSASQFNRKQTRRVLRVCTQLHDRSTGCQKLHAQTILLHLPSIFSPTGKPLVYLRSLRFEAHWDKI